MLSFKKQILMLVSFILVLACLTSATVAWIAMNRNVESKDIGMTIETVTNLTTFSCFALQYDGVCGASCYRIGTGENETTDVSMTEFDKIFRDRNVNTPLIYVLEVANVSNNADNYISVKVPCLQKYIKPTDGDATNSFVSSTGTYDIQQYISNVIMVRIGCSGAITAPTPTTELRVENNVNIFNEQRTALSTVSSGDRFGTLASAVTENGVTTYSKANYVEVKLSQSEYGPYVYEAEDEEGETSNHLVLYIEFDYNNDLMDAFINHMTDSGDTASFVNDLGTIQVLNGTTGGGN